jgi:hypothetical protein
MISENWRHDTPGPVDPRANVGWATHGSISGIALTGEAGKTNATRVQTPVSTAPITRLALITP